VSIAAFFILYANKVETLVDIVAEIWTVYVTNTNLGKNCLGIDCSFAV